MTSILNITDLRKTFKQWRKKIDVLKWVDINIEKWELYAFLWPNGSWKTTTLKSILGFLKPSSWEISIFWKNLFENPEVYKKIWYAPENAYFYDHLNAIEFLIFAWQLSSLTKQEAELKGLSLLEQLWLSFAKNKLVKSYSKWMRQRLWLAASLINDPDMIFWDEPMSWLDPLWRMVVKDLMLELNKQGKTIFFNTHILSDVEDIADKFGIIHDWQIIYEENTKNIQKSLEDIFKEKIYSKEEKLQIV